MPTLSEKTLIAILKLSATSKSGTLTDEQVRELAEATGHHPWETVVKTHNSFKEHNNTPTEPMPGIVSIGGDSFSF